MHHKGELPEMPLSSPKLYSVGYFHSDGVFVLVESGNDAAYFIFIE